MSEWRPINTAPRDGSWFTGRRDNTQRGTQWGKVSHVPIYGWCFVRDLGDGGPDYDLWEPEFWKP